MIKRLAEAPYPELSSESGFSGNRLERRSEKRSENSTREALQDERAHLYLLQDGRVLLKHDEEIFDAVFAPGELYDLTVDLAEAVLLGFQPDETPVLAAYCGTDKEELPAHIKAIDLRSVFVQGLVPPDKLGAIAQASALVSWNRTHRFCSRCGHESRMTDGGYKRICPSCQGMHFPRTDPVVIMLILSGNDVLLGRSPGWPEGMWSLLAGFVEPGESLEQAVRRDGASADDWLVARLGRHRNGDVAFEEQLADVRRALLRLSSRERNALLLVSAGELRHSEAAAALGISESVVKIRVLRARKHPQEILELRYEST